MKRAVSVGIGSSRRDKSVQVRLLGTRVLLERIGTDGDMEAAAGLYRDLDGLVDAFGVGGADLGVTVGERFYPLHSVRPMVRFVRKTPVVDGSGLKHTLEAGVAAYVDRRLGDSVRPRRVLVTSAADRWGMAMSFYRAGYECIFGDLMFALGLPLPLRTERAVRRLAAILMPVVGRLPFHWVYPTGEKQEARKPRFGKAFAWATVIAGDAHYIRRHMPERLDGKLIVTNTTTPEDVETFRRAGAAYLVTSTPRLDGRTFGTNLMEAALVAISGKGRALTHAELRGLLKRMKLEPQLLRLN